MVGSTMNCSWNVPILLLGISIPRSLKFGNPSTWMPSPHIRNWLPIMKDPETLIATPSSPCARHWSFSTTCTNFSGGQSPINVVRILDRVVKMLLGPTCCFPEKLQNTQNNVTTMHLFYLSSYMSIPTFEIVSVQQFSPSNLRNSKLVQN